MIAQHRGNGLLTLALDRRVRSVFSRREFPSYFPLHTLRGPTTQIDKYVQYYFTVGMRKLSTSQRPVPEDEQHYSM